MSNLQKQTVATLPAAVPNKRTLAQRYTSLHIPNWIAGAAFILVMIALGLSLEEFPKLVLGQMLIAGLFAMSLNLILGYGGMVHFGHAAFYGLGAYAFAILTTNYDVPILIAILVAPFVSAFVAVFIGWFCVRRVRLYFSILTLAFGQLIFTVITQAREFTRGDDGIQGLHRPDFLATPTNFFLFTLFVFVVCFIALRTLTRSPFVLTLRAIRENSERAQFIGINVRRHQLITFVVGAFFAGIAGMMMAMHNRFVATDMLYWHSSSEPILASLLGGMFSLTGPAIGAAVLVFLNVTITRYTQFWPFVLGLLTVGAVLVAPTGIVGLVRRWIGAARAEE
jgi:branched-chain amino acid transport system permease protein